MVRKKKQTLLDLSFEVLSGVWEVRGGGKWVNSLRRLAMFCIGFILLSLVRKNVIQFKSFGG